MTFSSQEDLFIPSYARQPLTFVRGEGALLFDSNGKQYIDLLGGIAVVSVGHANEAVTQAVVQQLHKLSHASNIFWTTPMIELATRLKRTLGGWGKVFFCNSGTEASECAIKLARKWGAPKRKFKIVSVEGSFHGRTLGALAATGQPSKKIGFSPLPEGFIQVPFGDLSALDEAIDEETVALFLEPIQGEGGVIPASLSYLQEGAELARRKGILFLLDEVQTGVGRTGSWWAFQQYGVIPDIITTAKGLANGLPIGACIARDEVAAAFSPGDHGSTFGGSPVPCAAACAVLDFIEQHSLISQVREKGELVTQMLSIAPHVKEVRGKGLMLGIQLDAPVAAEVMKRALQEGIVLNNVRPDTLRLLPPLVITNAQLVEAVGKIISILQIL